MKWIKLCIFWGALPVLAPFILMGFAWEWVRAAFDAGVEIKDHVGQWIQEGDE
jgi:hypothetical protein